jgi:hypothetical protein
MVYRESDGEQTGARFTVPLGKLIQLSDPYLIQSNLFLSSRMGMVVPSFQEMYRNGAWLH